MTSRHLLAGALIAGGAVDVALGVAVGEGAPAEGYLPVGVLLMSVGAVSILAGLLAERAARQAGRP